jgi:hypothetical protein
VAPPVFKEKGRPSPFKPGPVLKSGPDYFLTFPLFGCATDP